MKRTKPTKRDKVILNKPPHGAFGGCMPNPPKECEKHREFVEADGTEYINNIHCGNCRNKCQRHKEFKNEWKIYWNEYRRVKNKLSGPGMVVPNDLDEADHRPAPPQNTQTFQRTR